MVGPERATIFPLAVGCFVALANGDPAALADRTTRLCIGLFKPRNNERGFRLELAMGHVVVRKGAVKRVLPRHKRDRDVVLSRAGVWRIETTVVRGPVCVPGAFH